VLAWPGTRLNAFGLIWVGDRIQEISEHACFSALQGMTLSERMERARIRLPSAMRSEVDTAFRVGGYCVQSGWMLEGGS
jgi:hypothetical protein